MNILVLNYEFPPLGGGAAPVTEELCSELAEKHSIDVITMHYKGLRKFEKKGNVNIHRVNCIRLKKEKSNFFEMLSYLLPAYFKARELIKSKKYDIIHAHFIIPTGIVAYFLKKKFHIPYIITSHGSDVPGYNPDRFKILHIFLKPIWKLIVSNSDKIVTPSEILKKLILANYPRLDESKIRVIHNGIKLINKKISLQKKEKIVLYAGRLFKRKGVQYLIEASDVLPIDWKIIICGDGDYRKELEKLAKNKKNIKFLGWVEKKELFKLYEKSSIFVLPSSEESFGMVLLEAMMFGNAIITTKGTGTEEVVNDSGILVEKNNSDEMRSALKRLAGDNRELKKYQEAGLKRSSGFSWKIIGKEYEDVLEMASKGYLNQ